MALRPALKEPEPTGPTPDELLAVEREARARMEQEGRERQAAYEARLEQLERQTRQPQPYMTAEQAQKELGLTADDIAKDPEAALTALEEHIRRKTTAEIEQKYGGIVAGLASQSFQNEMESLKGRKYWAEAEKEVTRYFQENPNEVYTPGRAKDVYSYLVGQNVEKYEAARAAQEEKDKSFSRDRMASSATRPVYDEPIRRAAPSEPKGSEAEPELSEAEELVRQKYNALGANISKREWVAISEGKLFPKTSQSSDWQQGWRKDGRNVRGGDY